MSSNTSAVLLSVLVGKPVIIPHGSKGVLSGIYKQPAKGTLRLSATGVEGDGQGDMVNHGGPDKAVCVYFRNRYPYWESHYGRPFPDGSFGENFTLSHWTEEDLCIGDIVRLGEATLQVSQPRQPCYKLGLRNDLPTLPQQAQGTGYTGFYFRVLSEGMITAGQSATIIKRDPKRLTIADANRVMYGDKRNAAAIAALLEVDALSSSWREQLQGRLAKISGNV